MSRLANSSGDDVAIFVIVLVLSCVAYFPRVRVFTFRGEDKRITVARNTYIDVIIIISVESYGKYLQRYLLNANTLLLDLTRYMHGAVKTYEDTFSLIVKTNKLILFGINKLNQKLSCCYSGSCCGRPFLWPCFPRVMRTLVAREVNVP